MRFWDSSAIVPLFLVEPASERARALIRDDADVAYWGASPVECIGAFARNRREGIYDTRVESDLLALLEEARSTWTEIGPHETLRRQAIHLLRVHPLRAADSLQLAAGLVAADHDPGTLEFVCLDA